MDIKISPRLKRIADMVPKGSVVCDIGCDHALLPIYLLKNKMVNGAIAMDVGEGPINSAKKNISNYGLSEKIQVRLSDGFDALQVGEATCIIIAGMGGLLMNDILKRGRDIWEKADCLILSPHRDERLVREYLGSICRYEEDLFIKDGKEIYTIMRFSPQKPPVALSERELMFGLNPSMEYIVHKEKVYKKILNDLSEKVETEDILKKKNQINKFLRMLEEKR